MTLIVDVRLLTSNDGQIDKEDEVAVGNGFINTMWKSSKVLLNVYVNTNEDSHFYKVCKKRQFFIFLHIYFYIMASESSAALLTMYLNVQAVRNKTKEDFSPVTRPSKNYFFFLFLGGNFKFD